MAAKESRSGFPGACHWIRSTGAEIRGAPPAWRREHERVADPCQGTIAGGIIRCDCVYSPRASCVDVAPGGLLSTCQSGRIPARNPWMPDPSVCKLADFRREKRRNCRPPGTGKAVALLTDLDPPRWIPGPHVGKAVDSQPPSWQTRGFLTPRRISASPY